MLKWIGNLKGLEGIPGIPARDLTVEEVKKFGKTELLKSGCYEVVKETKANGTRD